MNENLHLSMNILYITTEINFPLFAHFLATLLVRAPDKREYLVIIFLFLIKTICCDHSSEASYRDGSDDGS